MHSRRLIKALRAGQLLSHAISTPSTKASISSLSNSTLKAWKQPDVINLMEISKNRFQNARLMCNASKDASTKDKEKSEGEKDQAETVKEEPKGAEATVKSAPKVDANSKEAADIIKSQAGESKLQGLLKETQALVKEKDKMVVQAKQEVLTYLAEVENVRGRTRRDAESIKKHAVEVFATDLLDMADSLGHTATIVPETARKETLGGDSSGNAKLLKSLLEGVDMTQKQLMKIFSKFGVEKFDPIGQKYDTNEHLAITEVEDESKEPQTIVNVVKSGYLLNGKLIRPAEVGVVKKRAEVKPAAPGANGSN